MGYSIIAPLFPPLFKERGISNITCSYLLTCFCITNILSSLLCSYLSTKFGQQGFLLFCTLGQAISVMLYGLIIYIPNNELFLALGFIIRLCHGFFSGNVNVLSFAFTALINFGKDLEKSSGYMELSWVGGLTIGPMVIGVLFDYVGYSIPFYIIACIALSGACLNYFFIYKANFDKFMQISSVNIEEQKLLLEKKENENEIDEKYALLKAFAYPPIIFLMLCQIEQVNSISFYLATLVNYLKESFNLRTSRAALFFIFAAAGNAVSSFFVSKLTNYVKTFQIMYYGLFLSAFFVLFIGPAGFLPHNYIFILLGMFIEGNIAANIYISVFIELNNAGKRLFPTNKLLRKNIPSSIYNLCFYVGDLLWPVIGSYFTNKISFKASVYFSSFLTFCYAIIFGLYFKNEIKSGEQNKQVEENLEKEKIEKNNLENEFYEME